MTLVASDRAGVSVSLLYADAGLAARIATEHLLSLGHRTVWHIPGPQNWWAARDRLSAVFPAVALPVAALIVGVTAERFGWGLLGRMAQIYNVHRFVTLVVPFGAVGLLILGDRLVGTGDGRRRRHTPPAVPLLGHRGRRDEPAGPARGVLSDQQAKVSHQVLSESASPSTFQARASTLASVYVQTITAQPF